MKRTNLLPSSVAAACFALAGTASAQPAAPLSTSTSSDASAGQLANGGWPHAKSDVKPDPAVRYGTLPNGMRYALMANKTPPGQAAFRLRIDAGSLMEREDQLGLAHFMEHMMFNGSKDVPEGEFVKRLERLGMSFGGDTNASTSFDETIYSFDLPRTTNDVVDTALLLFRESADKAAFEPAAIDRERGVVLAEERMGAGPEDRAARKLYAFLMKGQLVPTRFPIGKTEILRNAPRERFLEFYESYYRPENATFIAVGDFDVGALEAKIKARFGDWRGQGPAGVGPKLGDVAKRGLETGAYVEPGVSPSVTFAWASAPDLSPDSFAKRDRMMRQYLALSVFNRRLARLTLRADPPFSQASAGHDTSYKSFQSTIISASTEQGKWQRALEAVEQEQRRATSFDIPQGELDRAIKVMRAGIVGEVAATATRSSYQLAANLLTSVNKESAITTPAERLRQFDATVRRYDAKQASTVLRDLFAGQGPLVFIASPTPIAGEEVAVKSVLKQSQQTAVAPVAPPSTKPWSYARFGPTGRVVDRTEVADLNTVFVRFANGVRLTVRPNRYEQNRVVVRVRAGDGQLDLRRDRPSINWALRPALVEGGLGRLTLEETDDVLAGRKYTVVPSIGEDNFALSGDTQPADLPTQLQVLAAYATDAAFRPNGFLRTQATAASTHAQLAKSPSGVLSRELSRYLRSGDEREALPPLASMEAMTIEDFRQALAPLRTEPIEVVIAGDIIADAAIAQVAATFGALPARRPAVFPPGAENVTFPQPTMTPVRLNHEGRADQAMAYVAWPTDDFFADMQKSRTASVLAYLLRQRMTDELREKQGITYSPGAGNEASRVFPKYGYLTAVVETPPEKIDGFFQTMSDISRALRDSPVSQDDLDRAVRPAIEQTQRTQKGNDYWIGALSGAQTDARRLDAIRTSVTGLQRVTAADVQRLARGVLRDEKSFKLIAVPTAFMAAGASGKPR